MTDPTATRRAEDGPSSATPFVVGIGASAGGLEALESLFDNLPPGSGAAYVVVQHLSPDFRSMMSELIARHTKLQIHRAEDGMVVEPECIYLIPPRVDMRIEGGCLRLTEQPKERSLPLPIDIFFRSLAEDAGERAVGVILSGTGSDGSRGVQAIKEAGGTVMVQDEDSAKFNGMPRAALATGAADVVLPPEEMGPKLVSYFESPVFMPSKGTERTVSDEPFKDILELIKRERGVDFERYKGQTVQRRMSRRMGILRIDDIAQYRNVLLESSRELDHLVDDLLIGVTEFFRDREAFEAIEQELPKVVELAEGPLRVWTAGCSTGEEAYSLAILLDELRQKTGQPQDFKVFATDVSTRALERGADGVFPFGIHDTLEPRRLKHYFQRISDGYRVIRSLRDRVVFANHNLFKDPPFTRMHLVVCRNLLIYMDQPTQQRILHGLHFALVPKGLLFLGPSETLADLSPEFEEVHSKWKVFRKRRSVRLIGPNDLPEPDRRRRVRISREGGSRSHIDFARVAAFLASSKAHACLILDGEGKILHVFGESTPFVRMPDGRVSLDILRMLAPEARTAVSTAMHRSRKTEGVVRYEQVRFGTPEEPLSAALEIQFLPAEVDSEFNALFVLSLYDPERASEKEADPYDADKSSHSRILHLEEELQHTKENLQATIEELETTNEELQSTNEELLSSNEELQSTNEELHSVNEELYTVNAEHQKKIQELTELSDDVENLLSSTEIGTIFLDQELRIRKYTPVAEEVVALLASDIGRPIHHLSHALSGIDLSELAREVLKGGLALDRETVDHSGVARLVRVLPYRVGNEVSGVVITFVDLSHLERVAVAEADKATPSAEVGASRDTLTGLMDHQALRVWFPVEVARTERGGATLTALLVDIDDFTAMDESLGHSTCEVLLRGVAARLGRVLRSGDALFRLNGSRILALLPDTRYGEGLMVAERLRRAITDHPFVISYDKVRASISLAVGFVSREPASIDDILDNLTRTLTAGRRRGKNRVTSACDETGSFRKILSSNGQQGNGDSFGEERSIRAVSQTIRRLRDGVVVGYEMLSRGKAGPFKNPGDLFGQSRDLGVLSRVDLRCLRACAEESRALDGDSRVHVNLFPSTLMEVGPSSILESLGVSNDGGRFSLEIGDPWLLGPPDYLRSYIDGLRDAGVRITLDEVSFGRGALESIAILEPDMIKVTRGLITGIDRDVPRQKGLERLLRFVRSTIPQSAVIAKGVETNREREVLQELGVEEAQGYLWEEPTPVSGLLKKEANR